LFSNINIHLYFVDIFLDLGFSQGIAGIPVCHHPISTSEGYTWALNAINGKSAASLKSSISGSNPWSGA
jgi:hypothetical protein